MHCKLIIPKETEKKHCNLKKILFKAYHDVKKKYKCVVYITRLLKQFTLVNFQCKAEHYFLEIAALLKPFS